MLKRAGSLVTVQDDTIGRLFVSGQGNRCSSAGRFVDGQYDGEGVAGGFTCNRRGAALYDGIADVLQLAVMAGITVFACRQLAAAGA